MEWPFSFTLRGSLLAGIGVLLALAGGFLALSPSSRLLGVGMIFTGMGVAAFGITNGFSDPSRLGVIIYRLGLVAFGLGAPAILYAVYKGAL